MQRFNSSRWRDKLQATKTYRISGLKISHTCHITYRLDRCIYIYKQHELCDGQFTWTTPSRRWHEVWWVTDCCTMFARRRAVMIVWGGQIMTAFMQSIGSFYLYEIAVLYDASRRAWCFDVLTANYLYARAQIIRSGQRNEKSAGCNLIATLEKKIDTVMRQSIMDLHVCFYQQLSFQC